MHGRKMFNYINSLEQNRISVAIIITEKSIKTPLYSDLVSLVSLFFKEWHLISKIYRESEEKMIQQKNLWVLLALINTIALVGFNHLCHAEGKAHRILLDTDVDTDDVFALFYLLKLNRSRFGLEVSLSIDQVCV